MDAQIRIFNSFQYISILFLSAGNMSSGYVLHTCIGFSMILELLACVCVCVCVCVHVGVRACVRNMFYFDNFTQIHSKMFYLCHPVAQFIKPH